MSDADAPRARTVSHLSHWGAFRATVEDGRLVAVAPHPDDPAPTALIENFLDGIHHDARVARPAIRKGWLLGGPGPDPRRGSDGYVEVEWPEAIEAVTAELRRVRDTHGNQAIYGGSYGWASAGRFHHAQSQVHRFLNSVGGYTYSVNSYSDGAAEVLLPRIVGPRGANQIINRGTSWKAILEHTDLVVAFGGMNLKNSAVSPGGMARHMLAPSLASAARRGLRFELVSPLRADLPPDVRAQWHPIVPGADTAMMLALSYVLVTEDLHDREFLARWCVGADRLVSYVLGDSDGLPKSPEWAEHLSGIEAATTRDLARRMAAGRTLVTVSYSLQRARHGEQPVWMGIALAALLGQIGLPGGGFGHGYASSAWVGAPLFRHPFPTLPQGTNNVGSFIPCAQITHLLEHPGGTLDYDGHVLELPDIRLVYWCGGNPFHHHQDLNRLRRALQRVETVVVHDPYWTPTAQHADIVLPSTVTLEREDIGASYSDGYFVAMRRALEPFGHARDDYDIFADLAKQLDVYDGFTEGRTARDWIEHLYERARERLDERGVPIPPFDTFWEAGEVVLPPSKDGHTALEEFRADPEACSLGTPSGRIELFSETIDSFGYDDCAGHPVWLAPDEWLHGAGASRFPLHLIANQPATRLHSQLDAGRHSRASKVGGREPIRMHPDDAAARGIRDGDVVRVYNDRGSCYAGVVLTTDLRPQVVNLSTGAWYTPVDPTDPHSPCAHGNPNVLTSDRGTSSLAQGCTGQHVLVEIEAVEGDPPAVRPHRPPRFVARL
jgi:biotin/methionine sulfoxide reductase